MFSRGQVKKIQTKVEGFDLITGGGLPSASAILLVGNGPKKLLVRQICWNILQAGGRALYGTLDQSADDVRMNMAEYGWDIRHFEATGACRLLDIFSELETEIGNDSRKPGNKATAVTEAYRARAAQNRMFEAGIRFLPITGFSRIPSITIIDSISPLLLAKEEEQPMTLRLLREATRLAKTTGIGLLETDSYERIGKGLVDSFSDGIVYINSIVENHSRTDLIEVAKYLGEYKRGVYTLEADKRGLRIISNELPQLNSSAP